MTDCVRFAWLDLYGDGTTTMLLEDPSSGYFCTDLSLGSPTVREVTNNKPDQNGTDDRTSLLGSRAVTANISALVGAGARIDQVASSFGPYMDPSKRPVLHYMLDRDDAIERTITLRASNYAWSITGPFQRDIQLAWVAADPIAYDATIKQATAWAGVTGGPGRYYPLGFDRSYPTSGGGAVTAQLYNFGDLNALPLTRIYGSATQPIVVYQGICQFAFLATLVLNAGDYADIDSKRRIVFKNGDTSQTLYQFVDWSVSAWPYIPPTPPGSPVLMTIQASSASGVTQADAYWQDAYYT